MATVKNPDALNPMDVLHCGASTGERPFMKLWHRLSCRFTSRDRQYNPNRAIHTALAFPVHKTMMAVEMIGPSQGLRISALNRTWDGLERNIISISRAPNIVTELAVVRVVKDLNRWLGYDTEEALRYAFPFLKNDPSRPICSSYAYQVLKEAGHVFAQSTGMSPVDLQNCPTLKDVRNW